MSDETVTGAPGVQSHVPGQDEHDQSAAGVAPGAGDLDAGMTADEPAAESLDGSGDSLAGDAAVPDVDDEEGLPGDGDSITGETDARDALSGTEGA